MKMIADDIVNLLRIRPLVPADAAAYRALRLAGMQDTPDAFCTTYEEERRLPLVRIQQRLILTRFQHIFGAFQDGKLVGIAGYKREPIAVVHERASIWGVYVRPGARGKNVAKELVLAALKHAGTFPELRRVTLSVRRQNTAAKMLYLRLGFVPLADADPGDEQEHMVYILRADPAAPGPQATTP